VDLAGSGQLLTGLGHVPKFLDQIPKAFENPAKP
jgi:hypothetical protein